MTARHKSARLAPRYARSVGVVAFLTGLTVLTGWMLGIPTLTSIVIGWPQMAPLTAATAALCGIALYLAPAAGEAAQTALSVRRRVVTCCGILALLLGLLRVSDQLFGWNLRLDLLGMGRLAAAQDMEPAIMSPAAAFAFTLIGGALTLASRNRWGHLRQVLGLLALLVGWMGLMRFAFGGVPLLPYSRMAIQTALVLFLLATGVLALHKDVGLAALLAKAGPAGSSTRRLLPAAFIVPLIAGAIALLAQRTGVLGVEQAFSLFALSSVVIFAGLVWINGAQLEGLDAERRRAQDARHASEEHTRLIIETALDAVVTIDRYGIITGWNPQAESLFGWRCHEAIGQKLTEIIIPERYREAHQRGIERYLDTGEGPVLNRRIEIAAIKRDRNEFTVELAITPIRSGESVTFSAFVRDVTERLRAENALRESQELLQSLVDNSPAVIYAKYLDGRYLLVNRRFEEIFQIRRDTILGQTDHDLFPREAADAFRAMDVAVAEAGQALTEEEIAPHVDGPHDYLSIKAPLHDVEGKIYAILGISTDITDRKRAEQRLHEQLERLSLLDQTTRAISERQDVRSIFQIAIGSLEKHLPIDFGCVCSHEPSSGVLRVTCVGTRSHALAVELALTEDERIAIDENGLARCVSGHLVHEPDISASTYAFPSRLAGGGLRALVMAPLAVEGEVFGVIVAARKNPGSFSSTDCEFLRQLSEHLALAAHQSQLYASLQRAYDDLRESQQSVMLQERLRALGQMASGIAHDINNALSPAALYAESLLERDQTLSDQARESIAIIQRAIEDVGRTVARMRLLYGTRQPDLALSHIDLETSDTGVGMTEAIRNRCLEPFFTTKGERGTGLGLAMVYGMAQRHNAELEIESQLGTGTTLRLIFPIAESGALQREVAPTAVSPRALRILLVDDDPILLEALRNILEADGHTVTAADGGQQGIKEFLEAQRESNPFAVVITDLGMPNLDGRAVASAIKTAAPATPVVLLTGWGYRMREEQDLPAHVDRVLSKPPRLAELRIALSELIDGRA